MQELDKLKHLYSGLDDLLSHVIRDIAPTLLVTSEKLSITYFPYMGYLISIPVEQRGSRHQVCLDVTDTHDDLYAIAGLQFQFAMNSIAYYKNEHMHELDEHIGDIIGRIEDIEIDIIFRLQAYLKDYESDLVAMANACAAVDCFVPAERAVIGLTDAIYSCLHLADTWAQPRSSFMTELDMMSLAIHRATPHSLVVIDEFGCNTLRSNGLALYASILHNFASKGGKGPRVFATTHFHELCEHPLLASMPVMRMRMYNIIDEGQGRSVQLYRLLPGIQLESLSFQLALEVGLPADMVQHAKDAADHVRRGNCSAHSRDGAPYCSTASFTDQARYIIQHADFDNAATNVTALLAWLQDGCSGFFNGHA
ncbi:muts domain V-domain-containing protein [Thamnocephalis sphaerospora]|uniref:Muts domain V-domain-containing protein n=1 Tax=Thamnocephalis sphaerospora TaxID=78915 RepID=A0A4P9XVS9_9FUNG|nr:muts domain V-domain-containing protein [Thamnocephalis sphaerospora]|eukprot:RKP10393.1 muts domain V-domain-containing protein [Thamnocephalis sphaerospora]